MEVNRLLGDELTYELQIRNLNITGTCLKKVNLDGENELTVCSKKLEELKLGILNFDFGNRDNDFKRIYSRLLHVSSRLRRIACDNQNQVDLKGDLVSLCAQLIGDLNLAFEGLSTSQVEAQVVGQGAQGCSEHSILDEANPLIPEVSYSRSVGPTVSYDLVDIAASRTQSTSSREQLLSRDVLEENPHTNAESSNPQTYSIDPVDRPSRLQRYEGSRRGSDSHVRFSELSRPVHMVSERLDRQLNSRLPMLDPADDLAAHLENVQFSPIRSGFPTTYEVKTRLPEVSRWNLRFNGRTSVNDFLERVEELRVSRGVTKDQLLRSAPELFTQDALFWYRTGHFASWEDLSSQLKAAFQPYDYEYMLWDEIRRRTQGSQEKIVNFVAAMENLFRKLPKLPSEETRINLIRRNLLPYIQQQLSIHTVPSLTDLVRLSRAIEETEMRVQKFLPPPTNPRNLLEPELGYRRFSAPVAAPVSSSQASVVSQPARPLPISAMTDQPTSTGGCYRHFMSKMFKKRFKRSSLGRTADLAAISEAAESRAILNYILAHAKNDTRPYLRIDIYGREILGLLDSGATRTFLGGLGWESLKEVCSLNTPDTPECVVANGQSCTVIGSISLPMTLNGRTKVLDVLVVPSVSHQLILGMDFWKTMQIIPDIFSNSWSFRDSVEVNTMSTVAINSIETLTDDQRERLIKEIDATVEGAQLFKRTNLQYPDLTEESDAWLSVVPKNKRAEIIREHHDPPTCGHLGVFKTQSRIAAKYYWPKLKQDCSRYISRCTTCLSTKPEQRLLLDISKRLKDAYQRSRQHYNLRKRNDRFHLQQRVWKRSYVISDATKGFTSKLAPKFDGPYTIVKVLSPWSYELADDTGLALRTVEWVTRSIGPYSLLGSSLRGMVYSLGKVSLRKFLEVQAAFAGVFSLGTTPCVYSGHPNIKQIVRKEVKHVPGEEE
ncbi:hypothetical protein NQ317_003848 [Molorchus minor]|uniref:Integrase zinc-binding domain-containing protein n=1 Tax=Molorchus minor TaxID=1323400 RepID=A0ABQ9ISX3_9CUCU|nr:hypothetical protein NQ317_003848 [Molorchus minor]